MKTIKYAIASATFVFLTIISVGCKNSKQSDTTILENSDETEVDLSRAPSDVTTIDNLTTMMNSIINGNVKQLAQVCNFPIWRPYPEKPISDEKDLAKMFDILFDDSIRNSLKSMSANDWEQVGWRGYMLNNGEFFWATCEGNLDYINYESAKLLDYRQKLREQEKQNINESDVWQTHDCFISTDSTLFLRLESFDCVERLHIFMRNRSSWLNHFTLNGTIDVQGTCHSEFYTYSSRGGYTSINLLVSSPRCIGEFEYNYIIEFPKDINELPESLTDTTYILLPAYWREVKKWW